MMQDLDRQEGRLTVTGRDVERRNVKNKGLSSLWTGEKTNVMSNVRKTFIERVRSSLDRNPREEKVKWRSRSSPNCQQGQRCKIFGGNGANDGEAYSSFITLQIQDSNSSSTPSQQGFICLLTNELSGPNLELFENY
ncbi:unnamed protein product [Allacma fusca]|uniref:Uncharacterized protein n=1 Tax=Allacma fusca TaxID=39272 RepID=A0A8J2KWI7_9HEXA|nr:unnamed protein product [Allacma fusca]